MLRKFFGMTIILIFAAVFVIAQEKDSKMSNDETAIRANVKQMETGWNANSGAEFAKPFAEDSDYVVVNGTHIKGRAANAAGHQQIFNTIYKDSRNVATIKQIRFVRPDVAVVHVFGTRRPTREADSALIGDARITMTMVKNNGKWEIAAFQNTSIQPTGGK